MTKDEIILEQSAMLAKLNREYELLQITYSNLCSLREKEADAFDAYVDKYGPELKDKIMSVPF